MKILFLADNFPPEKNAQAARVFERACYWVRWGHQVTVITCAPNFPEGRVYPGYRNKWRQVEEMSGIRVVRVKTFIAANRGRFRRTADFLSYMAAAFAAGLFEERPDIVAATSPQFFAAVAGWALARIRRTASVLELSDLWPDSIVAVGAMKRNLPLRMLERVELYLYNHSAVVVALTRAFKENLVGRGIPASKVSVVLNGVDLDRYRPAEWDAAAAAEWSISRGDFVVGYIGTLGMAHGLENVLECASMLQGKANARFLFVGPGAERESLVAQARARALKNVLFVPAQPKDQVRRFWSLCSVALVHLRNSSIFETVIPSKIFEAMAMGLPILVAAPEGEASRLVLAEGAGLWVPAADPAALAETVGLLESDRQLRSRLAADSLAAARHYSRERQAREMLACFQSALTESESAII